MGKVLADRLGSELNIPIEWLNIEIHPDTPPQGRSIQELFPPHMVQGMYDNLNQMGTTLGLKFVAQDRLSNSQSAILLGEYIHLHHPEQENGYHDAVFKAYFSEGKDIGQREILSDLLQELGIDPLVLPTALNDIAAQTRMQENAQTALDNRVTGTPTFFIGSERVVGAQPYPSLLAAARRALGLEGADPNVLPIL
ncbi:DsbA family oxidoreductase [Desulfosporosinus fructosivorans]